ncbi:unnamed protein product [Arctogadus glacialis]
MCFSVSLHHNIKGPVPLDSVTLKKVNMAGLGNPPHRLHYHSMKFVIGTNRYVDDQASTLTGPGVAVRLSASSSCVVMQMLHLKPGHRHYLNNTAVANPPAWRGNS